MILDKFQENDRGQVQFFFRSNKLVKFKFCTPAWGQWLTVQLSAQFETLSQSV